MTDIVNDRERIEDLGRRWAAAEVRGDTAALDGLSTDDLTLVGPVGFVLDHDQWLARYEGGSLVTRTLVWDELDVRVYGDAAVVIGRHTQQGSFQGRPVDGEFRATHVVVRQDGEWRLAGIHLSAIGGPPPFARPAEPA